MLQIYNKMAVRCLCGESSSKPIYNHGGLWLHPLKNNGLNICLVSTCLFIHFLLVIIWCTITYIDGHSWVAPNLFSCTVFGMRVITFVLFWYFFISFCYHFDIILFSCTVFGMRVITFVLFLYFFTLFWYYFDIILILFWYYFDIIL
jgi:hypothetical protein